MDDIPKGRSKVLVIVSSHELGIEKSNFISVIKFLERFYDITIGSPLGGVVKFRQDSSINEIEKNSSEYKSVTFDLLDTQKFSALYVPSMYTCLLDLTSNNRLGYIINEIYSRRKVICCIGYGVGALLSTTVLPIENTNNHISSWLFYGSVLTGPTFYEEINEKPADYPNINFNLESRFRMSGSEFTFSNSGPENPHVIIDGSLVTAQNQKSFAIALHASVNLLNCLY